MKPILPGSITIFFLVVCLVLAVGTFLHGIDDDASQATIQECIGYLTTMYWIMFLASLVTFFWEIFFLMKKDFDSIKEGFIYNIFAILCLGEGMAIKMYLIPKLQELL